MTAFCINLCTKHLKHACASEAVSFLPRRSGKSQQPAHQSPFIGQTPSATCPQLAGTLVLPPQVNPLAEDREGKLIAADAKLGFDDNASFRQKEVFAMKDDSQIDPRWVWGWHGGSLSMPTGQMLTTGMIPGGGTGKDTGKKGLSLGIILGNAR